MKSSLNSRHSWGLVFFCVMSSVVNAAFADAAVSLKAVELPWGKVPLTVDGDFSDWGKKIAWRDDFQDYDGQSQTAVKCRFALKRDRENLYVA